MATKRASTAAEPETTPTRERPSRADEPAQTTEAPTDSPAAAEAQDAAKKKSPPWLELFREGQVELSEEEIKRIVHRQVAEELDGEPLAVAYNILFLYDDRSIDRSDADRIYRAVENIDRSKPLLLILHSRGGVASAAYFIAKIAVSTPRVLSKSAWLDRRSRPRR
jgi:hypothetical protein